MPRAQPQSPAGTRPPRWKAVCKVCGRTFPIPEADSDDLLKLGWPVCCDRDMSIFYYLDGVSPADLSPGGIEFSFHFRAADFRPAFAHTAEPGRTPV
jgi:hypothetical protein